jgi:hypothetical protein
LVAKVPHLVAKVPHLVAKVHAVIHRRGQSPQVFC